jgi:hypothetical protein
MQIARFFASTQRVVERFEICRRESALALESKLEKLQRSAVDRRFAASRLNLRYPDHAMRKGSERRRANQRATRAIRS